MQPADYYRGGPLRIGNRRQLLLDETVVEERFRLTRRLCKVEMHPHNPVLTPDRRWILFTGGDPASQSSHIFLLDVSDLGDSEGISPDLLSPTGSNDLFCS